MLPNAVYHKLMFRHFQVGDQIRTTYGRKFGEVVELVNHPGDKGMTVYLKCVNEREEFYVHEYFAILIQG